MIGGIGGLKGLDPRRRGGGVKPSLQVIYSTTFGSSVENLDIGEPSPDRIVVVAFACKMFGADHKVTAIRANGKSMDIVQHSIYDANNGLTVSCAFGTVSMPGGRKLKIETETTEAIVTPYGGPILQVYRGYDLGRPTSVTAQASGLGAVIPGRGKSKPALVSLLKVRSGTTTFSTSNLMVHNRLADYTGTIESVIGQAIDPAQDVSITIGGNASNVSTLDLVWK